MYSKLYIYTCTYFMFLPKLASAMPSTFPGMNKNTLSVSESPRRTLNCSPPPSCLVWQCPSCTLEMKKPDFLWWAVAKKSCTKRMVETGWNHKRTGQNNGINHIPKNWCRISQPTLGISPIWEVLGMSFQGLGLDRFWPVRVLMSSPCWTIPTWLLSGSEKHTYVYIYIYYIYICVYIYICICIYIYISDCFFNFKACNIMQTDCFAGNINNEGQRSECHGTTKPASSLYPSCKRTLPLLKPFWTRFITYLLSQWNEPPKTVFYRSQIMV